MELILYPLIVLLICIAVGAVLIMVSTRLVAGFSPKFMSCAITAVAATIAGGVVSFILQKVLGAGGLAALLSLVVTFLVYAAVINALIKRPDGSALGFGKSALVTLVVILIEIVVFVILAFLFGTALMALFGGVH